MIAPKRSLISCHCAVREIGQPGFHVYECWEFGFPGRFCLP
jgi:hypothetical protein